MPGAHHSSSRNQASFPVPPFPKGCLSGSPSIPAGSAHSKAWKLPCTLCRHPVHYPCASAISFSLIAGRNWGWGHSPTTSRRCRAEFSLSASARAMAPSSPMALSVSVSTHTHTHSHTHSQLFQHLSQPIAHPAAAASQSASHAVSEVALHRPLLLPHAGALQSTQSTSGGSPPQLLPHGGLQGIPPPPPGMPMSQIHDVHRRTSAEWPFKDPFPSKPSGSHTAFPILSLTKGPLRPGILPLLTSNAHDLAPSRARRRFLPWKPQSAPCRHSVLHPSASAVPCSLIERGRGHLPQSSRCSRAQFSLSTLAMALAPSTPILFPVTTHTHTHTHKHK